MSLGRAGLILEAEMYLISCGLNLNPVLWLCLLRDRSRSIGPSLGDFRGRGGGEENSFLLAVRSLPFPQK